MITSKKNILGTVHNNGINSVSFFMVKGELVFEANGLLLLVDDLFKRL